MAADRTSLIDTPAQRLALAELLDRALTKGVVLRGDAVISVADIALLYIDIRALIASVDTAARFGADPDLGVRDDLPVRDL